MGYLCIFIAVLAGASKGFLGKKISDKVTTHGQTAFVNLIRMLICIPISLASLLIEMLNNGFVLDWNALLYGALSGVFLSVFLVTWMLAVRHGAFMLVSVAQMFGVVIAVICSFFVFREKVLPRQLAAIGILVVSVLIMASYSNAIKGRLGLKAIALLVLCGVSSGLYDFSLKLFTQYSASSISVLNLITYILASVGLSMLSGISYKSDSFDKKVLLKRTVCPVIIMSVCLFLNSYFKAMANNFLPATVIYPINQAGGLILSALMSSLFFKEKITVRCVVGMILAFVAILLLK